MVLDIVGGGRAPLSVGGSAIGRRECDGGREGSDDYVRFVSHLGLAILGLDPVSFGDDRIHGSYSQENDGATKSRDHYDLDWRQQREEHRTSASSRTLAKLGSLMRDVGRLRI